MAQQDVEALIHAIFRGGRGDRFRAAPQEVLAAFALTPEERRALLERDYGWLYAHGVHPMAVLFYSQFHRAPMAEYLRAIGAPAARVAEFQGLDAPEPAHGPA